MNLRTIWGNALPMGTLVGGGKYRIDWLLGRGGFGITYRATHIVLGRVVAIKEFFPRDFVHRDVGEAKVSVMPVSQSDYERGLDRFLREGRVLSQIKEDHIVRVEDFFRDNETAYLVMEMLDGNSLRAELKSAGGSLPGPRVFQIIEDLVQALSVTHAQKVWHCDIKPDNIQILPSGRAVLLDFGAAHQGLASQSTRAFTRDYAAPELETGKPVDGRTDLFELGMLIHEMVTGRRPPLAVDRMMKDTWNTSHLRSPWKSWLPPLLQMRPDARPESVVAWWKKRPKSVPGQAPFSPPLRPVVPPVVPSAAPVPAVPPLAPPLQTNGPWTVPQTPGSLPPLRPAPRMTPTPGAFPVPFPLRLPRRVRTGGRFRKLMTVLAVLTPFTVFFLMWVKVLPVNGGANSYSSGSGGNPHVPIISPTPLGPDWATKKLERVIAQGQNEAAFRLYIGKGADLRKSDYKDSDGNSLTPLLFAIKKYGDANIVQALADKGARINTQNGKGESPLHFAARLGRTEAALSLLQAGAQINAKDDKGWTPLHVCAKYGQESLAKLLAANRANVNARSNYGGTPLHVAAYYGQAGVASSLVDKGADVNAKDSEGGTPLHIAAHGGKVPVADFLLQKGARINEPRGDGDTPLHVAIQKAKFDVVRLFVEKGADVNIRNKQDETPLHFIVRTGQQGLTEQLLGKGADVNVANQSGETPLHLAARRGNIGIVRLLLDKGANPNAASKDGATPLQLATGHGQREIADLLLSRGANANTQNQNAATPNNTASEPPHSPDDGNSDEQ